MSRTRTRSEKWAPAPSNHGFQLPTLVISPHRKPLKQMSFVWRGPAAGLHPIPTILTILTVQPARGPNWHELTNF